MKTENLSKGMVVKNYKEMCNLLEEVEKDGGRNRKLQMEDWKRYFDFEKQGQKIIIKEVYDMPTEKNLGGNYTPYIKYIEILMLDLLAQSIGKGNNEVFLSKNKLFKELKMTNGNYAFCKNRTLKLSKLMDIDKDIIEEWYNSTDGTLKRNLENALDNLRKQSLIIWSSEITVCEIKIAGSDIKKKVDIDDYDEKVVTYKINSTYTLNHREATKEEKIKILHIERENMLNMGYSNKQDIVKNGEWEIFKDNVNKVILKELNISYYYDSYKILFNEDHIQEEYNKVLENIYLEQEDRENNQNELNAAIIERLKNNSQKRQDRAFSDPEYLFSNFCSKKLERRTDDNYIIDNSILVDTLINKNAKNIIGKIKKVKYDI